LQFSRPHDVKLRDIRKALPQTFDVPGTVLVVLALLLYAPGLWWGLPYATSAPRAAVWGTDELAPLQSVTEVYGVFLARQPHFNPQYPLFHNLMQLLLVGPYIVFLWVTGGLGQPHPLYPFGFTDPVTALRMTTLLARAVSYLMAAGVVLIAYRTGTILKDRLTGCIAGLMALCIYPMFYYSRTSNVDMGALFWTTLGLLVFARYLRDGLTTRRAVWLGIFAALATGSKDASWPAFLMMGLVIACTELSWPLDRVPREKIRQLALGFAVAAGAYAVATGLIFRPSRYWSHLEWVSDKGLQVAGRHRATLDGYWNLALDFGRTMTDAMGVPMALCALAGVALCCWRERRLLVWLLPAAGIFALVLVPARFILLRFVLVIAYVMTFFAAYALREAWQSRSLRKIAPVLLVIVSGWSMLRGGDLTWQMLRDSRYEAGDWLRQYARGGDRVLHFGCPCGLPALEPGVRNIAVGKNARYAFKGTPEDPEFVVLVPYLLFPSEPEHEPNLPEPDYRALRDGSLGYQRVLRVHTARLFERRPLPFVNPPVQVFVRKDLIARLSR
jgi:hypothetical protein